VDGDQLGGELNSGTGHGEKGRDGRGRGESGILKRPVTSSIGGLRDGEGTIQG